MNNLVAVVGLGKMGLVHARVGYLRRFHVTFRKARSLPLERAIDDLISFRAYAYSSDFYARADYIGDLPNIRGVVAGVSKEKHARETFRLFMSKSQK